MNVLTTARKATLAALAAIILGGGMLTLAAPANAGPGHGHGYRHHHPHHGHFYRHRHSYGYGAAGVVGGLALGALAAGALAAQPVCYDVRQPIVDRWGNLIRYRIARVCD